MQQACTSAFLWLCLISSFFGAVTLIGENEANGGLPFCGVSQLSTRIVVISTLDGKISALDAEDNGSLLWSVHPGQEPLLSYSQQRLELTSYGQLVRIIPSVDGGLYTFNGESMEPMALSPENLLQSSFRYSDDIVISGGKESQTVGLALQTGEILYECTMRGCSDSQDNNIVGDVLLLQRLGKVVRGVTPRTGSEKWNFSIVQHDLNLLSECHSPSFSEPRLNLKVVIPDGLVCAMDSADSASMLWKHKFGSPIVNVWEIHRGNMKKIDLFSLATSKNDASPGLYVGMHGKQLYVQESGNMLAKRMELAATFGKNLAAIDQALIPKLPWKPIAANALNAQLEVTDAASSDETALEVPTTALSVLYASPYVEGKGFFLYSSEDRNALDSALLCNMTISGEEDNEEEAETPVTIVIVSLWYWWKEVAIISITTAIGFNLLFTRRYLRSRVPSVSETHVSTSDSGVALEKARSNSESQPAEFQSRYLSEFVPVNCLGKGGFGVVFEAKNKLDDCHYAIKRIVLPDKPDDRERVMREVRALAKMDHHHIVRYFNAWMECPPPGWQQEQDRSFIGDMDVPSGFYTETTTNCYPSPVSGSQSLPLPPGRESDDASDSFIVFKEDSKDGSDNGSNKTDSVLLEHAITIDDSSNDVVMKRKRSGKRRKTLDWSEHSSIWHSPSKVYLYIQMQLCKRESLKTWLQQNPDRNHDTVMTIFGQIVRAVDYVHSHKHIHRDLKPSNILFSMDQEIKVSDFGLVTTILEDCSWQSQPESDNIQNGYTSQVGTQLYMSPEQLRGQPYSHKIDIFSLGLILFELLVPFSTEMERLTTLQDVKLRKFPKMFAQKYKTEHGLLKLMLSPNPEERPDTVNLLSLPVFSQYENPIKRHRRDSSVTSQSSFSSSDNVIVD